MATTVVSSQTHPLAYAKAIATLVGTIVTGLLGIYTGDTEVGKVLTIIGVIATAVATWSVPNAQVDPFLSDGAEEGEEGVVRYAEADGFPDPYDPGAPLHGEGGPEAGDPHRY